MRTKAKPDLTLIFGIGPSKRESAPPGMPGMAGKMMEKPGHMEMGEEPEGSGPAVGHVRPEAVSFRSETEVCHACEYMQQDGTCAYLGIPVAPGDSCNLFEAREAEPEEGDEQMPEMEVAEQ